MAAVEGFGLARVNKKTRKITFEAWARTADIETGKQMIGWPITIDVAENDSRMPAGHLKGITLPFANAVVELINEKTGETVYCRRVSSQKPILPIFQADASYTVKYGKDKIQKIWATNMLSKKKNK